jgi:hypothetical protein
MARLRRAGGIPHSHARNRPRPYRTNVRMPWLSNGKISYSTLTIEQNSCAKAMHAADPIDRTWIMSHGQHCGCSMHVIVVVVTNSVW